MDAYQRQMFDGHALFFAEALTPLSGLTPPVVRRRSIGSIGAREGFSDSMVRGHIEKDDMISDFAALTTCWP